MTRDNGDYKKYGFEKIINGDIIEWKYYDENSDIICNFNNYYLSERIYEKVFKQNDLQLTWIYPDLEPKEDKKYWDDFFENSPIIFMEAKHIINA